MINSYRQPEKAEVRHKIWLHAVETLTVNRNRSCCVERGYPRKIYDYFSLLDESKLHEESSRINLIHLKDWEKLHDSFVGNKKPEDLIVCYLSGPEPENDFNELINLGVLSQNIWAFESDKNVYKQAIKQFEDMGFPMPKILKMSIENFFKHTPKKFDIIYIDACGAIPSEQHALRCIASACKHHRLNSPGVIITNFAEPDLKKEHIKKQYVDLLTIYYWCKDFPNDNIEYKNKLISSKNLDDIRNDIYNSFNTYYGNFIRNIIMDLSSILIPILRICNSSLINDIGKITKLKEESSIDKINYIKNNSLWKFFVFADWLLDNDSNYEIAKLNLLMNECMGIDGYSLDIMQSFGNIINIKENTDDILNTNLVKTKKFFNNSRNIYQFLDNPNSNLFFDAVINQLAYPLHYVTNAMKSYQYKAKSTTMYTDVFVFDECRYIYEWMPAYNQILDAFKDTSWQYVFRFSLDGLVKSRIKYNNEFFFQGSVISSNIQGFGESVLDNRNIIP